MYVCIYIYIYIHINIDALGMYGFWIRQVLASCACASEERSRKAVFASLEDK